MSRMRPSDGKTGQFQLTGGGFKTMCVCTPNKRTPYCGAPGCKWPEHKTPVEEDMIEPQAGQVWRHKTKQTLYFVVAVRNARNPWTDDNNPPHIHYMDGTGGDYSRDINDWHKSLEYVGYLGDKI